MSYASWSVVFGEQPSAAKWNILGTNDSSFNDGTGISALTLGGTTASKISYKFGAYHNTTQSRATNSKILFNTEDYDTGSNFDNATNYRFTAPIAGFYYFTAQAYVQATTDAIRIELRKNGSSFKPGQLIVPASGNDSVVKVDGVLSLALNDFVEVYYTGSSTRTLFGAASTRSTSFEGFLLSVT